MPSFANSVLQLGNVDIFFMMIEKFEQLFKQQILSAEQTQLVAARMIEIITKLRNQSYESSRLERMTSEEPGKAAGREASSRMANENYEIDIFLMEQNGFWVFAHILRRFIKRTRYCSSELLESILSFANSFVAQVTCAPVDGGDVPELRESAGGPGPWPVTAEQVELAYLSFISVICNFDIWCQVPEDKQLLAIENIKQSLHASRDILLLKFLQNGRIRYLLKIIDVYYTQQRSYMSGQVAQ